MKQPPKGKRLVGIIPLATNCNDFKLPWPWYLNPIGENYLAIERSIYECALVGCESIWVVCNDDTVPLVKERLGDYIMDPKVFDHRPFIKNKEDHKKYIPIFYTPVPQKDRGRRDSLSWSILHGALTAFQISSSISSWAKPTKYYVSFPAGVYDPEELKQHRASIRGPDAFFISYDSKTVENNRYLGFTFFPHEWVEFKRLIKRNCSGGDKGLPIYERWSSRNFKLDKIFNSDIMNIEKKIEVSKYFDISTWDGLMNLYRFGSGFQKPSDEIIKPFFMKREKN